MITLYLQNQKPKSRWLGFWAGVLTGIVLMALADITGLKVCAGECDGNQISLRGLLERQQKKKTDRLPLEIVVTEHR